jgi:hypothetical protein
MADHDHSIHQPPPSMMEQHHLVQHNLVAQPLLDEAIIKESTRKVLRDDSHLYNNGVRTDPILPSVGMIIGDVSGKQVCEWAKMVASRTSATTCWMDPDSNAKKSIYLRCVCSRQYLREAERKQERRLGKQSSEVGVLLLPPPPPPSSGTQRIKTFRVF